MHPRAPPCTPSHPRTPSQVWGLTGMILAVPMTAVLRIHLSHIEHPLTRYVASALDGTDGTRYNSAADGGGDSPGRPHTDSVPSLL